MTEKGQRSNRPQTEWPFGQSGEGATVTARSEQRIKGLTVREEVFNNLCIGERGEPVLG